MIIGAYEMESPLMNAGGVVKTIEDVRMMAQTGVGAILAGSYTLEPRVGNSPNGERVYYHDEVTGITYNSLGMPNNGIAEVAKELPEMISIAHDLGKPFILNIAPVTSNPAAEIAVMLGILEDAGIRELDGLELNAGCPNVVTADGGRHELLSHHTDLLGETVSEIIDVSNRGMRLGSLMVRISPFRDKSDATNIAKLLVDVPVDFVSAFNTFPGGIPVDSVGNNVLQVPGGAGGQSGAGKALLAEEQTLWLVEARDHAGIGFEILGSNGIQNARSMKSRMDIGASAVSLTTLFYEARSWGSAVSNLLDNYADLIV
jgi:dihydroorotate dehydrogenase